MLNTISTHDHTHVLDMALDQEGRLIITSHCEITVKKSQGTMGNAAD